MIIILLIILLTLLLSSVLLCGYTDHSDQILQGKPSELCDGIRLGATTISDLIHRFGEPSKKSRILAKGYSDRGTAYYVWIINGLQHTVATHFIDMEETPVYSIELELIDSQAMGTCILPLGIQIDQVLNKYRKSARITAHSPDGVASSFEIEWQDGTTLNGTADRSGKVFYLHLLGPIE